MGGAERHSVDCARADPLVGDVDHRQHHAAQTFGRALICGEPMQIRRRLWVPLEDTLTPERSYVSAKWILTDPRRILGREEPELLPQQPLHLSQQPLARRIVRCTLERLAERDGEPRIVVVPVLAADRLRPQPT